MSKEIGSDFEISSELLDSEYSMDNAIELLCGKCSGVQFLSSGRSAIRLVLEEISARNPQVKKTALLPSYTCRTVIDPFISYGYTVFFYPIDCKFNVDLDEFRKLLIELKIQVVLIHRYFGFDTLHGFENLVAEFKNKGIIFIEDKTHSLYSDFISLGTDYTVASLRKWAALPDGGYATCADGKFQNRPTSYDIDFELLKTNAAITKYRYLYDGLGNKESFLTLFRQAEERLASQSEYYHISPTSIRIQQNLNLQEMKTRRRSNYSYLYAGLKSITDIRIVMPQLSKNEVPLYFVISYEGRDILQQYLKEHDIYAPIIWPNPGCFPGLCTNSAYLYDTVLCVPIDQRYTVNDMTIIAQRISNFMV